MQEFGWAMVIRSSRVESMAPCQTRFKQLLESVPDAIGWDRVVAKVDYGVFA